ncbi:MAG TPA: DEAD/DEAH box helicase [Victivallales bacterium]|nr:DEAD/DEAH box helicase [Victivallales bacterium]
MFTTIKRKIKNLLHSGEKKKSQSKQTGTRAVSHSKTRNTFDQTTKQYPNKRVQPKKKSPTSNVAKKKSTKNYSTHVPHKPKPLVMPELKEVPKVDGETRFSDFDIQKEILCGLQSSKFKYCTEIQRECIPHLLLQKDIAGKAQTGTGKTAAFLISIFSHLLKNPPKYRAPGMCRVLIIAPTRELAIQIYKDAEALGKYCGFNNLVVYGGTGYKKQQMALQKPIDILVGTPGRLLDYSSSKCLKLNKTEIFVIDEADRMLDMGFIPDVRRIVNQLPFPGKRQTMLFSATLSVEVMRLVKNWQVEPVMIEVQPDQIVAEPIEQLFYSVMQKDKNALLLWLLENEEVTKTLIFVNRRDFTQKLKNFLIRNNKAVDVLSGDIPQNKREKILGSFRKGRGNILIATDVASRGIHVDDVSHVINYDLPERAEDYIHRIGRTGRAGKKGKSISFLCEYGSYIMHDIEEALETEIKSIQPEPYMLERKRSQNSVKRNYSGEKKA